MGEPSQELIEYIEELTKPPGLVLTLGKIEVSIKEALFFLFAGTTQSDLKKLHIGH